LKSTGNDIVALRSIDHERTSRPRFYSKILSVSEQLLYRDLKSGTISFTHYVWLLWSVKEAAYKYLQRIQPGLLFSPLKIITQQIDVRIDKHHIFFSGSVTDGSYSLFFQSELNHEWISTIVNQEKDFENVHSGISCIDAVNYDLQSKEVRTFLLKILQAFIPGELQVKKTSAGYPLIVRDS
jgi:phosphopantetheinyl transferase (holo-ACP synthase)